MDTAIPTHISPGELAARIGAPNAPLLLDVRRHARFADSTHLLATAQWCAPDALASLAPGDPPREVVVYCVHGHEVSQQAAATLRQAGWNARFLAGGIDGGEPGVDTPQDIAEWRALRPPVIRKRPDLGVDGVHTSVWITRERPKIDRIACPWLVRRLIDPRATFLYAPTASVLAEAARRGAVAFDLPGAPISHDGELCSFDTLLGAFDLQDDPALAALARIVRAADTDRLELAPPAAGLLALSLGLSALHATDDLAMLEAAMPMYDALFAWCRQAVAGQTEHHNWTPEAMKVTQP
ncbi:chromate resistance protein ChrB domain-containing protein [Hydrogenophaga sp.]|uniref:chromate resistance protein ChrB domain-containing protein n=1 Tax=Hydrogenophaga sp. TaxID=1904254 RepID=UPI002730B213|nr:chromate resistance protein ChrB domain-containing protein [Hydrogenophaga sp.]MDP1782875.1 chromate resistance protein [Hydrogenophaga sp.]MDP2075237.1 chromate resistance protein [Hydrogenophaga sp.]MDP3109688.1 chromate resistance protein [Hydrogenophaga sp.]MDP3347759.1 chromate resistance protein [Hydrogenophaga sp.]MDZ4283571.1 chromate resistance protein [Hydrogenophaga sp.]